jgi:hypothetical protein
VAPLSIFGIIKPDKMIINKVVVTVLLLSVLLFSHCGSITKKLSQETIDQHLLAYEKIAAESKQLDLILKESEAISIYLCKPCQPILDSVTREAGYTNFESFLLMDLRLMYTMQYVAYLEVSQIIGASSKDIPQEELCDGIETDEMLSAEDKIKVAKFCQHLTVFLKCISTLGNVLGNVSSYLLNVADFEIVQVNYDHLFSGMSSPDLPDGFGYSAGGYDD